MTDDANSAVREALGRRMSELTALTTGWDGYGGRPVSAACADAAAGLLDQVFTKVGPVPSLVPGGDGTLQIEWHVGQYDLEIEVLGAKDVFAHRHNRATGSDETISLEGDVAPIAGWLDELGFTVVRKEDVQRPMHKIVPRVPFEFTED